MQKHRPKLVVGLVIIFCALLTAFFLNLHSVGLDGMTAAAVGVSDAKADLLMGAASYLPVLLFLAFLLFAIFYLEKKS